VELEEFDKILASAKMPEAEIPLCLRGDLQAEWELLDAELNAEQPKETATLAGRAPNVELAQRIQALEAEMANAMVTIRLRAFNRDKWFALTAKHPPRTDVFTDLRQGFNGSTIWDELIADTILEPQLDAERVTKLLDSLTAGQVDRVAQEAWNLNRQDVTRVPFSLTASRISPISVETSKPQPDSGSPTDGGPGGNRRKSPSTSTKTAG